MYVCLGSSQITSFSSPSVGELPFDWARTRNSRWHQLETLGDLSKPHEMLSFEKALKSMPPTQGSALTHRKQACNGDQWKEDSLKGEDRLEQHG